MTGFVQRDRTDEASAKAPAPAGAAPRVHERQAVALLWALVALAYLDSLDVGFTLDSAARVVGDARVRHLTLENLALIFSKDYWWPISNSGLYRPLVTSSWLLNHGLLGGAPWGFHLVNMAGHAACAWLVYRLGLSLDLSRAAALAAAAVFAVHPVHTEAVTNLVGRADVFATLGVLGAYVVYRERLWATGRLRAPDVLACGTLFLAALLSKEHAAILLPLVALHHWAERRERDSLPLARGLAVLAVPGVLAFGLRAWALHDQAPFPIMEWDNPIAAAPASARAFAGLEAWGRLLLLVAWPARLCADYSYEVVPLTPSLARLTAGHLATAAVLAATAVLLPGRAPVARRAGLMLAFAVLAFLPTSNLLFPIGSPMAERFLYLATPGLLLAAAIGGQALWSRLPAGRRAGLARPAIVAMAFVLAALTLRTALRNRDWVSDDVLWSRTLEACPGSLRAHLWDAQRHLERVPSEPSATGPALAAAERAMEVSRGSLIARIKLGVALAERADVEAGRDAAQAARMRRRILDVLEPVRGRDRELAAVEGDLAGPGIESNARRLAGSPDLCEALGRAYAGLGRLDDARAAYEAERDLTPDLPGPYRRLGSVLAALGDPEQAATTLFEGLLLDSDDAGLRDALLDIYRAYDPSGCALVGDPPRVNAGACPPVRDHLCGAYARLGSRMSAIGKPEVAGRLRLGARQSGCPIAPSPEALP